MLVQLKHYSNIGLTLTAVATLAVVFEQVELYQSLILLRAGIILIVITSLVFNFIKGG